MRYETSKVTGSTCMIKLLPDTDEEHNAVNILKDEDTLLYHYQQALSQIHKDAVFLAIINDDGQVNPVKVQYQIAKGIG